MTSGAGDLYAGLMSGTSLDAIDAVLVRFDDLNNKVELLATREHPFPEEPSRPGYRIASSGLITWILITSAACIGSWASSTQLPFRNCWQKPKPLPDLIAAVGTHGQTIRHQPDAAPPFTLQIGDAATIATTCGIPTVSDFRSADIACGGQGAPLAPAFHNWAFAGAGDGAVLNLGGIANITLLRHDSPPLGYDTGPSNTLLDTWYQRHHRDRRFDENGSWSAQGKGVRAAAGAHAQRLVFPAASTEEHRARALQRGMAGQNAEPTSATPVDVQATLAEMTARSVAEALTSHLSEGNVWVCGGGARNADLMSRLQHNLPEFSVAPTDLLGIPAEWVEAVAFAWLARARMRGEAAGLPSVTGAAKAAVLGCVHLPAEA